jgi:hypothetical protein
MKFNYIILVFLLFVSCRQQVQDQHNSFKDLNGNYFTYELIGLQIDTLGKVDFYGKEIFTKEKWFHEVSVTINDSLITILKYPVTFGENGLPGYSASDGGFLSYSGKIVKYGDYYIANTKLYDCDYIGLSPWQEPPKIVKDEINGRNTNSPESFIQPDMSGYDTFTFKDGRIFFLVKGTIKKDFILRFENKELWINNVHFYKRNKGHLN